MPPPRDQHPAARHPVAAANLSEAAPANLSPAPIQRWTQRASAAAVILVLILGTLGLLGWLLNIPGLKTILPHAGTMKPNTALGLLAAGAALALLRFAPRHAPCRFLSQALALVPALIGALTLMEYLFALDLGIDRLLLPAASAADPTSLRISTGGSLALLLTSLALILAHHRRTVPLSQWLTIPIATIGMFAFLGYLYGLPEFTSFGRGTRMSPHYAAALLCLAFSILHAHPTRGLSQRFTSPSPGGWLLRHLTPAAILLPVVLGFLRIHGERLGYFDASLGVALTMLLLMFLFTALIASAAHSFDRLDVTRQRAEQALALSESRFRQLFETSRDALMTLEPPNWAFTSCNAATLELFGARSEQEFFSLGPWSVSPPLQPDGRPSADKALEMIHTALRQGAHFFEWTHRQINGPAFPATVLLARLSRGSRTILQATVRDITAQKQAELHERRRLALEDAVHSMEQIFGVVAHELRTPLASIRAMSELLLEPAFRLADQSTSYLSHINHEVIRMAETINNLLEAARAGSGYANWNWDTVPLLQTCEAALDTVRPLLDPACITLACHITPPDLEFRGDPHAIQRLVLNLLRNAQKHTTQGRIEIRANPCALGDGPGIELLVRDTGAGIAPATALRLGEAFALNAGIVGDLHVNGTGLGLAICKTIAAAHGGAITVQSALGRGTTITVRLRADLAQPAPGTGRIQVSPPTLALKSR